MNLHYNIHNLFSLQLTDPPDDVAGYITREWSYFKSSKEEKPNLNINFIKEISLPNSGVGLLSDFYYQNGWLWLIFPHGAASICIETLATDRIQALIQGSLPGYIIFSLIEEIMYLKLLERDHCLIHAACYKEKGKTILYAALPGTGKTTSILNKCSQGAEFLSDDLTIISKEGLVYAYPRAFCIGKYHKQFFNKYFNKLPLLSRIKYKILKLIILVFSKSAFFWPKLKNKLEIISAGMDSFRIRIDDVVDGLKISDREKLDEIRVIFKNNNEVNDNKWDEERIENFLILNSNRELIKFFYLHFIAFLAFGDKLSLELKEYLDNLFLKQKEIVSTIVNNCENTIVCIKDVK